MKLLELTGYHKFEDKTLDQILGSLTREGKGEFLAATGSFGLVIVPDNRPYVYKLWLRDYGYEIFLEQVRKAGGNRFFIKPIGPVRKAPAFFRRAEKHADLTVNVVKLEKLKPLSHQDKDAEVSYFFENQLANWYHYGRANHGSKEAFFKELEDDFKDYNSAPAIEPVYRSIKEHYTEFEAAAKIYRSTVGSVGGWDRTEVGSDLHEENVMWRGDQLVITDPYCVWEEDEDGNPAHESFSIHTVSHNVASHQKRRRPKRSKP